MNKRKGIERYLDHIQNTSPTKISYTFRRTQRFRQKKSFSPNKYYDQPNLKTKIPTSIGYGKKVSFVNNSVGDPGQYQTQTIFQKSKLSRGHTFQGATRQKFYQRIYKNGKPGPGEYNVQSNKKIKFYIGKSQKLKTQGNHQSEIGPQTYDFKDQFLHRISKFNAIKCLRIKTQYKQKSPLQKYDNKIPGPGSYNLQKSMNESRFRLSKSNTFGRQQKLKFPRPPTNLGPGSYKIFSVFGGGDQVQS